MEEKTMHAKAMAAIEAFLERKGFDILEEGWSRGGDSVDLVARDRGDGDALVLVQCAVSAGAGDGFPEERADRAAFERLAAAYLAGLRDGSDVAVRLDCVSLIVLSDSRAFLRHHRNVLLTEG